MRISFTLLLLGLLSGFTAFGQQDAMFTKYMFNSLVYNPGYAGSREYMSANILHRTQWWGIEGAPTSQTITLHSPLKNKRVGVGLSAIYDQIGPTKTLQVYGNYAYRIPIGKGKLSIGLNGGMMNWQADWSEVSLEDPNDPAYQGAPNMWLPNFGVGLYYYTQKFYVGISSPHLIEHDLRDPANINTPIWAKNYRHYYFTTGLAIPIKGDMVVFKPSILVKNVGLLSSFNKDEAYQNIGAPTEFDIDLSLFFYQTLWIGASFRSAVEGVVSDTSSFDSIDIWAAYYLANGLRIGAAYDYTLTKLQQPAQGSFEIMLGYEFDYQTKQVVTPRYF